MDIQMTDSAKITFFTGETPVFIARIDKISIENHRPVFTPITRNEVREIRLTHQVEVDSVTGVYASIGIDNIPIHPAAVLPSLVADATPFEYTGVVPFDYNLLAIPPGLGMDYYPQPGRYRSEFTLSMIDESTRSFAVETHAARIVGEIVLVAGTTPSVYGAVYTKTKNASGQVTCVDTTPDMIQTVLTTVKRNGEIFKDYDRKDIGTDGILPQMEPGFRNDWIVVPDYNFFFTFIGIESSEFIPGGYEIEFRIVHGASLFEDSPDGVLRVAFTIR